MKFAFAPTVIVLSACVALSACAGVNYTKQNYAGLPLTDFTAKDGTTFRIVDNREEKKLLIGPGLNQSATQSFVKGLAVGSGLGVTPPVVFRDVAEEYLASTGRRCESRDITLVVDPYYEVRYACGFAVTRRNRVF